MEATNITYDFDKSIKRIDEILDNDPKNYSDSEEIPSRDKLSYSNGFYVYCSALFVDIRDSSSMTDAHKRPVLAKIYRSFISETIAIMNGINQCKEININGDCVWCVCDTKYKSDIDTIFSTAAKICSLIDILNFKLDKKGYKTINVGIGIDYGRALMIQAGHKGSSINDVIWMGDVVNNACHICNEANGSITDRRVFLSNIIFENLNPNNQRLCVKDFKRDLYQANIVNIKMSDWLKEHQSKK